MRPAPAVARRPVQPCVTHAETVCVFCGSSPGSNPAFAAAAGQFGAALAARERIRLWRRLSRTHGRRGRRRVAAGGRVTGVITDALAGHEIAHGDLDDLHVVRTMHERKALMAELSDAFVMLPGGFGTYEEFMESVTWAQLGIHDKRCGILNVDGFFDGLLDFPRARRRPVSSRGAVRADRGVPATSTDCSTKCGAPTSGDSAAQAGAGTARREVVLLESASSAAADG